MLKSQLSRVPWVPCGHTKALKWHSKGSSHIKVTHPAPCLSWLPPWENVNRSTILIYSTWRHPLSIHERNYAIFGDPMSPTLKAKEGTNISIQHREKINIGIELKVLGSNVMTVLQGVVTPIYLLSRLWPRSKWDQGSRGTWDKGLVTRVNGSRGTFRLGSQTVDLVISVQ